jgi:uncharacterized protein YkwD
MRSLVAGLLLSLSGLATCVLPAHANTVDHPASARLVIEMLSIINRDRSEYHIAPLHLRPQLTSVALSHSMDMAVHHYFSHVTPSGVDPYGRMRADRISYRVAGENLGYDFGRNDGHMLHAIDIAMLHSPEHRANLLRPTFSSVGIGIVVAGPYLFVTEDFTG